jgi:excisionase family DNA binding protein
MDERRTFLTSRDLAEWLGVSTRTVCLWAELGEIPAFRAGRQWRFRLVEIEGWLKSQRNTFARPDSLFRPALESVLTHSKQAQSAGLLNGHGKSVLDSV